VLTEWDEFKTYDWQKIYDNMLKPAFVFDGRKERETWREGDLERGRLGDEGTWREGGLERGRFGERETWRRGDLGRFVNFLNK
jgi:hypothetical protein